MGTAERIRMAIAEHPIPINGENLKVTVSIGVAVATDEREGNELLATADAALYRAKQDGRNRAVWAGDVAGKV